MKKRWKNLLKAAVLLTVLILAVALLNHTFVFFESEHTTTSWNSFYRLPKNTLDIVHVGSSHNQNGIIPVVESHMLELDAYSISSESGELNNIIYHLKEIYKTQKPKIVTLELYSLLEFDNGSKETFRTHKAFDSMRMSLNKIQGILTNKPEDDQLINYLLPFVFYHENWKKVNAYINDENRKTFNIFSDSPFNGYWFNNQLDGKVANDPVLPQKDISEDSLPLSPERMQMLSEIVRICQQNGSKVVFIMLPFIEQASVSSPTLIKYVNGLNDYAKQNDIDLLDYRTVTEEAGIYKDHFSDPGHLNVDGAYQITTWLASYLEQNYATMLADCTWDTKSDTMDKYVYFTQEYDLFLVAKERMMKEYQISYLAYRDNLPEYLAFLKDELYIAVISTKNSNNLYVDDAVIRELRNLGLSADLTPGIESNYAALVISGHGEIERMDTNPVHISNDEQHLQNLALPFALDVQSSGISSDSYIMINHEPVTTDLNGFHIAVFDRYLNKIVSTAYFNTNEQRQRDYTSELTEERFNQGTVVYRLDTQKPIDNLTGADSKVVDDGLYIHANSDDPNFYLSGYQGDHSHIGIKVEIECPRSTILEVMYSGSSARSQLVTGNNTVYLEINAIGAWGDIRIDPMCIEGDYILKSLEIAYLD